MFRRELLIILSLIAAIFLAVAGAGWFTVRKLHETSKMLVVETLPGLVDAGLAGERMNDNRRAMRDVLIPHTAVERARMIGLVKTNSTEGLWRDYAASIFEPKARLNYQAMILVRTNYIQGCDQFFDLVTAGKMDEASAFFDGELNRQFQGYNDAAKKLFADNVQQGIAREETILNTTRYAPWAIGGLCVLAFAFGLALGLRIALSGGK